jgi:hypothetical protein
VSEPGVLHLEAHFPYGLGTVVYDGSIISAEQIAKLLTEKTPFPATVVSDRPIAVK